MTEKKSSKKKIILQLVIIIIILATLLSVIMSLGKPNEIITIFRRVNYKYLFVAIGLIFASFFFSAYSGYFLIKKNKTPLPKRLAFYLNNSENFYNGITPFASGSQPFLAYYYLKYKVKPDDTTSSLMLNLIVYQFSAIVISTIALIIYYPTLTHALGSKMFIVWIGWSVSILFTLLMILTVYIRKFYLLLLGLFRLLAKIKPLRKIMLKQIASIPNFVNNYQISAQQLINSPAISIPTILSKVCQLLSFSSVIFYTTKALGVNISNSNYGYFFVISIIASTLMSWVPLPGTSGGTEYTMGILLTNLPANFISIDHNMALSIMLLWRLLSYYLGLLYGGIFAILVIIYDQKQSKRASNYLSHLEASFMQNKPLEVIYLTDNLTMEHISDLQLFQDNSVQLTVYAKSKENNFNLNYLSSKTANLTALRQKGYALIITDSHSTLGKLGQKLAYYTKAPLIYLLRRKTLLKNKIPHQLISIISKSNLVIIRNMTSLKMWHFKSKLKLINFLLTEELLVNNNRINTIFDKTLITKQYECYLQKNKPNLALINPPRTIISPISAFYNLVLINPGFKVKDDELRIYYKRNFTSDFLKKINKKYQFKYYLSWINTNSLPPETLPFPLQVPSYFYSFNNGIINIRNNFFLPLLSINQTLNFLTNDFASSNYNPLINMLVNNDFYHPPQSFTYYQQYLLLLTFNPLERSVINGLRYFN